MNNPLISIIVPVYNIEKYLPRCLDSLLAQTYTNIEIIAVNDGSTDNSGTVLDEYAAKDARIHVLHQQNSGVSTARLNGIVASKGDYIGFCDGDDEVDADMFERLLNNLVKYEADISHCGHVVQYVNGKSEYFYNTGKIKHQDTCSAITDLLQGNFEPGLCNKLYKRQLVDKVIEKNLLDTKIRINEDLLMNYYLFKEAKELIYEDFCPYHYMKREGSASTSELNHNHIYDPIAVKQIIYDDCQETELAAVAESSLVRTVFNILNGLQLTEKQDLIDEKQMLRKTIRLHRNAIGNMNMKYRILTCLSAYMPNLYRYIYRIYQHGK